MPLDEALGGIWGKLGDRRGTGGGPGDRGAAVNWYLQWLISYRVPIVLLSLIGVLAADL